MYKYLFSVIAFAFSVGTALAVSSLSVDKVRQRYPWNGMVDVTYTLSGIESDHAYEVGFIAKANGISRDIRMQTRPHCEVGSDTKCINGTFRTTWDAADANHFPEAFDPDGKLYAYIRDLGGESHPVDATGTPNGILGSVMILDISSGSTSDVYPVTYWYNADLGTFNCDTYKTDKMVFRKIARGDFKVGYGTSTSVNLPAQTVTTRKDYYISVFQVTQQQYRNVVGSVPGSQTTSDPLSAVGQLSWNALRASAAASVRPTEDCFIKRMDDRAKCEGISVTGWDLPTEIQWEIAARAGVETEYVNPEGKALSDYIWCTSCAGSIVHPVGLKLPNNWGIYDAGGNVLEWCLEGYDGSVQPNMDYIDSPDPARNGWERRVKRGGGYNLSDAYSRLSQRDGCYPYETAGYNGFRPVLILN